MQTSERGSEFTTGIWGDDYIIGLVSSYLGVSRSLTAESLDPVDLLNLSRVDMLDLMEQIPQFSRNIARILAVQAYDSMRRAGLTALEPAAINLQRIMAGLARKGKQKADPFVREITGLTQEDLASMVGVSRPWLNQTLASFERAGLIRRSRNGIIITDIRAFTRGSDGSLT